MSCVLRFNSRSKMQKPAVWWSDVAQLNYLCDASVVWCCYDKSTSISPKVIILNIDWRSDIFLISLFQSKISQGKTSSWIPGTEGEYSSAESWICLQKGFPKIHTEVHSYIWLLTPDSISAQMLSVQNERELGVFINFTHSLMRLPNLVGHLPSSFITAPPIPTSGSRGWVWDLNHWSNGLGWYLLPNWRI